MNIRKEWESLSSLTQAAVSGGCTLIVYEDGIHQVPMTASPLYEEPDHLYCDVGRFETIDMSSLDKIDNSGTSVMGFKGYMRAPSPNVGELPSQLEEVF